jgi:hypothetical protein
VTSTVQADYDKSSKFHTILFEYSIHIGIDPLTCCATVATIQKCITRVCYKETRKGKNRRGRKARGRKPRGTRREQTQQHRPTQNTAEVEKAALPHKCAMTRVRINSSHA